MAKQRNLINRKRTHEQRVKRQSRERYVSPGGRVWDCTPEEAYQRMVETNRRLNEAFGPPTKYGLFS